jgi:hypothetical protein
VTLKGTSQTSGRTFLKTVAPHPLRKTSHISARSISLDSTFNSAPRTSHPFPLPGLLHPCPLLDQVGLVPLRVLLQPLSVFRHAGPLPPPILGIGGLARLSPPPKVCSAVTLHSLHSLTLIKMALLAPQCRMA